jgi:hypothetical protein
LNTATQSPCSNTTFVETSDAFSLNEIVTGGDDEYMPPTPSGTTFVIDIVNSSGKFVEAVTAKSADNNVSLNIQKNVFGLTKTGSPLIRLTIKKQASAPVDSSLEWVPLDGVTRDTTKRTLTGLVSHFTSFAVICPTPTPTIIGSTYDLGPDGATFDPPIALTFTYDIDDIPQEIDEEDLIMSYFGIPEPEPEPTPTPEPEPTLTPEPEPTPTNWWLIGGIIAAVIFIGAIIWWQIARRRY